MAPAELQAGGRAGARDDLAQRGVDPRQVVGMHALERGTTHELGRGEAQQALDGVAGEQQGPVGGDEGDDVRAVLDQRAKARSEEHTSELQSPCNLVCRLLLEKKKRKIRPARSMDKNITCAP